MSVAQIEAELDGLSLEELRVVEATARRKQRRQHPYVLDGVETRLFEVINEPLPGGERLLELRAKREAHSLTPEELEELTRLDDEREEVWGRKLRAVAELADYRGVDFDALYRQLELHLRTETPS